MNALSLVLAAGVVAPAMANTPAVWHKGTKGAALQTHTYFNPSTGEKVVTILNDGVRPAESAAANPGVWIAANDLPCAAFGQTVGTSAGIDTPGAGTSLETGLIAMDWGDIANDTVVDCLGINYSTDHLDTDTDGDTVGDGVPGFAATWTIYDADNGFNDCFTRTGLIALTLFNLQGPITPPAPGQIATFTGTVDLGGTSSIIFEIGDSDSDLQGAAVHNANIFNTDIDGDTVVDSDKDGDGLYDFSYTIGFNQPGTVDFDGDTTPDGDPLNVADTGIGVALPTGTAVDDGTNSWSFVADAAPQAQGIEDVWDAYTDTNNDGVIEYINSFFAGGFSCNADTNGDTVGDGDVTPYVQWEFTMFGFNGDGPLPCAADLFPVGAPDGILKVGS